MNDEPAVPPDSPEMAMVREMLDELDYMRSNWADVNAGTTPRVNVSAGAPLTPNERRRARDELSRAFDF